MRSLRGILGTLDTRDLDSQLEEQLHFLSAGFLQGQFMDVFYGSVLSVKTTVVAGLIDTNLIREWR